ncbi:MAG: hypothetical protein NW201_03085 [Gemmatimonadales bacterium]|nr:hypothetical protein [Gemmatimonadales bacterium]
MQYFHRASLPPDEAMRQAAAFFGARLAPTGEAPRERRFAGSLGKLTVTVRAEGGHYTLVTLATDQPGESELDKLAKRFLSELHVSDDPGHRVIGSY